MKKKNILTIATTTMLLSVGTIVEVSNNNFSTVVEAQTTVKKLTHNAYVYNAKGKKTKIILKKGKKLKITSYKTIKGKKYAKIGKNKFIVASNFLKSSTKKKSKITKNKISKEDNNSSEDIDDIDDQTTKDWNKKYSTGAIIEATKPNSEMIQIGLGQRTYTVPKGTRFYLPEAEMTLTNFGGLLPKREYYITTNALADASVLAKASDFKPIVDLDYQRACAVYNLVHVDSDEGDDDQYNAITHDAQAVKDTTIYNANVKLNDDEAGDANENGYGNIQINKLTNHKILRSGKRVPYGSDGLLGLGKYNGSYYFIYATDNGKDYAIKADDLKAVKAKSDEY